MSRFAGSGFGGRNEADRCRSHPPPIIVLAAVWRADRPSPITRPDLRTDLGKQTTPRSGDNRGQQGTTKHPKRLARNRPNRTELNRNGPKTDRNGSKWAFFKLSGQESPPANQTKKWSVHELFRKGHSGTKVQSCLSSSGKTPEFSLKNGRKIHMNFTFWPFLWFGLPGRLLIWGGTRGFVGMGEGGLQGEKKITLFFPPPLIECHACFVSSPCGVLI